MQLLLSVTVLLAAIVIGKGHVLEGNLQFKGVNLSGAEYGVDQYGAGLVPGNPGNSYWWPHPEYGYYGTDYFINKGMNIFRVPFRWERIQPTRGAAFDVAEFERMKTTVRGLTARNVHVHLDMHNYMRYQVPGCGHSNDLGIVGQSAVTIAHFADLWKRLAAEFKDDMRIIFALNNEPHDINMDIYYESVQAAIDAIRGTGAKNYIAVMGGNWGGVLWYYPQTDANNMLSKINDPNGKILWDAHLYMDSNSSGGSGDCVSETIAVERATRFTNWLIANNQIGIISEFGTGTSTVCTVAIDKLLNHIEANAAHWAGWIWWSAGPGPMRWAARFKLEPANGQDLPQMDALEPHIKWQATKAVVNVVVSPMPSAGSTCSNKLYSQCGGHYFGGTTCCPSGHYCKYANDNWSDCQVGSAIVVAPGGMVNQVVTCKNVALSRCGGKNYTGATCCPSGYTCTSSNEWWSDCQLKKTTTVPAPAPAPAPTPVLCPNGPYNQCGGRVFAGNTCCKPGYYCKASSIYWSYCAKSTLGFDEAASLSTSMFDEAKAIEAAKQEAAISATEGINLDSTSSYAHGSFMSTQPQ